MSAAIDFLAAGDRLRPGLLEHDDPLSVSRVARSAEGAPQSLLEDAAGLHQRCATQLACVSQAGCQPA